MEDIDMPLSKPFSQPVSMNTFMEAVEKIKAMQSRETNTPGFNPQLNTIFLSHGKKTKRAILWLHGYTSATLQFKHLADLCFKKGYNVLVPCMPHHGLKDRLTSEICKITAKEQKQFVDSMVDIMHGLGNEVVVGGLSMGGTMTAWVAQKHPDVDTAIIIAAAFGYKVIPTHLTRIATLALLALPNMRRWWDNEKKDTLQDLWYSYPHGYTHSLVQLLDLSHQVLGFAKHNPPAAKKVWVVMNDHDEAVDNRMLHKLVDTWHNSSAKNISTYHFPDSLGLDHDCISVEHPKNNPKYVYPILMKMVEGEEIK
jgi:carboxylesterase